MTAEISIRKRLSAGLLGLAVLFALSGCGSRDQQEAAPPKSSTPSVPAPAATLSAAEAEALHRSGSEAYAIGVSGGDVEGVMTGMALLERAALGIPDNTTYWLDLADAYVNSGIALKYPKAIDIYWMLLADERVSQDALLARLAEAYDRVGNPGAAFDAARERLRRARPEQADAAGLHLALLTLSCDRFGEAAAALSEKAATQGQSAYLLLLASTLQEIAGDPKAAVTLIDAALKQLDGNQAARDMALSQRRRMAP